MSIITPPIDDSSDMGQIVRSYGSKLSEPLQGIPTGYAELDHLCHGLLPKHTIILGAETGGGKSVFAINLLVNIARLSNTKSLYLDLENGTDASARRFSKIARGDSHILDSKVFYKDHLTLEPILQGLDSLKKAQALKDIIEDYVAQKGVRVVVIDPLEEFELVTENIAASYTSIQQVVALFRDLAQKLSITVILIHHLRKTSSDAPMVKDLDADTTPKYRIPTIHDFLGSGKIVNTCTDAWCLVRQMFALLEVDRGRTLFRVLKARETSVGDVFFQMNSESLIFTDSSQLVEDHQPRRARREQEAEDAQLEKEMAAVDKWLPEDKTPREELDDIFGPVTISEEATV